MMSPWYPRATSSKVLSPVVRDGAQVVGYLRGVKGGGQGGEDLREDAVEGALALVRKIWARWGVRGQGREHGRRPEGDVAAFAVVPCRAVGLDEGDARRVFGQLMSRSSSCQP